MYYGDQQFKNGDKPIEHSWKKDNKKLKFRTLKKRNILGEPKYRDEKGNEYINIKSFQNRKSLPENEIRESQKKRNGNTLSPGKKKEKIS